jgi:hypothetical protein
MCGDILSRRDVGKRPISTVYRQLEHIEANIFFTLFFILLICLFFLFATPCILTSSNSAYTAC